MGCRTINKNPETEIEVQPEGQESKRASHSTSVQNGDPASRNSQIETVSESCFLPSYIPL